ncbi:aldose epimerase family protein [Yinghuangia soli]|uniref:Aldose 1-epimerase n=1 Tax=Yinghuangia soli TaxID=2908204 RepID=A0AA41Q4M6_9ACTN|nr:aldose epimerase family protein [Yinghuangia soli]MCF2531112.1 galactose mutarotase [Yinghuangia soli]
MSGLSVTEHPFGHAPDGTPVHRWVLRAPGGHSAAVLTYGATLQSCRIPTADAGSLETVLGLPSVEAYAADPSYLGAVVGRYANRIAHGRFVLDGSEHKLEANDGPHTLHGGPDGFHRRVWDASGIRTPDSAGVALRLRSPHGDMGFPGNLDVHVIYSLDEHGTLAVRYRAATDRPTVINLTQHAYWNLAESDSVSDHALTVEADMYLATDATQIPLGPLAPTAGTPFALGGRLGETLANSHPGIVAAGGLDHCFALRGGVSPTPRRAARLTHPPTGRALEVWTTEPGIQVYTGNFLTAPFDRHHAVCLETQHFPDAPNRPEYPSTVLRPEQGYASVTEYRFGVGAEPPRSTP